MASPGKVRPGPADRVGDQPCNACGRVLPQGEFVNRRKYGWKCPDCVASTRRTYRLENRQRIAEYKRSQYALNPERFRQQKRASDSRDPEKVKDRQRAWWAKNGAENQRKRRAKDPRGFRDTHLRSRYGISIEQYESMEAAQQGRCAICHEVPEVLCVDHCHDTGQVRGLLCNTCNAGIGYLRDDALLAYRAAQYLLGEVNSDGSVSVA